MKLTLLALLLLLPLVAQERVDEVTDAKMRSEELEHSQIMHTLHMLTDRYGPRVTGTPNHEQAAKWAIKQMTRLGLEKCPSGAVGVGHPGWLNESATGHLDAPVHENIKFEILAWTPPPPAKWSRPPFNSFRRKGRFLKPLPRLQRARRDQIFHSAAHAPGSA